MYSKSDYILWMSFRYSQPGLYLHYVGSLSTFVMEWQVLESVLSFSRNTYERSKQESKLSKLPPKKNSNYMVARAVVNCFFFLVVYLS